VTARALTAKTVDLVALVKPRIMIMALLTAAGAMSHAPGTVATSRALWLLLGCALIVGSANTLNMWLERDVDCLMARTKDRPLPQRRLDATTALVFGAVQGALSLPALAIVGPVPAALGLLALILYVGVYTPMKQRSHWAVWIGGIPGAMPALMGWTAATGRIDAGALALFGVLFLWQIPHFLAIAIFRSEDYGRAGFEILPRVVSERTTRVVIVVFSTALLAVSLSLASLRVAGVFYAATAAVLGAGFVVWGLAGLRRAAARAWARSLFFASLVYLTLLFVALILDHTVI
jgi:protoheme IX farnesyltransferase